MIIEEMKNDPNILNIYMFGSFVYGTNNENSDNDLIIVTDTKIISTDINIHYYTISEFQTLINNFEIQMLECFFLPDKFKIKEIHKFYLPVIDKTLLRINISTITSNSYQKCKKKLTIMGDYDKYLAVKSMFHSLRILDYGIQIATNGEIKDYSSMNYVMEDLMKISEKSDYIELWNLIETKYKKIFNNKASIFKQLCPKPVNISNNDDIKKELRKIFTLNNYENEKMLKDIILLFNKYK